MGKYFLINPQGIAEAVFYARRWEFEYSAHISQNIH